MVGESATAGFRSDIQGLRGVAVLLVVLYHAGWGVPGGFVGVDVFFVISGFVVTRSVLSERRRTGSVRIVAFYARRVRRLVPALAAMLTIVSLLSLLVLSPLDEIEAAAATGRAAALSLANVQLYSATDYFAPQVESNPFTHTWSLSVEEQFFLVFPLAAIGLSRLPDRQWRRVGVVAVAVFSFVVMLRWSAGSHLFGADRPERAAFYWPVGRAWEFAVGALLVSLQVRTPSPGWRWAATGAGAAAAAGLAVSALALDGETGYPSWWTSVPVGAAAVLIAVAPIATPVRAVLSWGPLTRLGDVSYGWYLWHWPWLVIARHVCGGWEPWAVTVSLGFAVLSYRWLEQPLRHLPVPGRAVAVGLTAVAVAVMTAQVVTLAGRTSLGIDGLATLRRENAGRSLGCHGDLADPVVIGGPCVWRVDQPRGSIFVAGDSHALAWSDVLVEVANAAGYDVYVTTRSLCPFQTVPAARRGCAGYQRDVLEAIERIRPTAVLVANRAAVYTDVDETLTGTAEQSARREALDRWESGLDTALSRVEATGARIALVDSVPEFGSDGARTVTVLRPRGRPAHLTIAELEHRRGPTSAIHHRLAAMHPNVVLVDPAKALCADGECAQWRDGTWLYRDDDHVSEAGAWAVLPEIAAALGLSVADGA